MKFDFKQTNVHLWFMKLAESQVQNQNMQDVLDDLNYKGSEFEIYSANVMFDELIKYVKENKEQNTPRKIVFFVTNRKCFDSFETKLQDTNLWKYIRLIRADAHGYSLKDLKKIAKQYDNIVFTNLNSINEYIDATHYARSLRQRYILIKKFMKGLEKIAIKCNVCLSFGYILPLTKWLDQYLEDVKSKYSNSQEFPVKNISVNFVYINAKNDDEKIVSCLYSNGLPLEEKTVNVKSYITKKKKVVDKSEKEDRPEKKEDILDSSEFRRPW